jgi:hypothetical protein
MIRLAAILSFFLSLVCYLWSVHHGIWDYTPFAVLGLLLWCTSSTWDNHRWQ